MGQAGWKCKHYSDSLRIRMWMHALTHRGRILAEACTHIYAHAYMLIYFIWLPYIFHLNPNKMDVPVLPCTSPLRIIVNPHTWDTSACKRCVRINAYEPLNHRRIHDTHITYNATEITTCATQTRTLQSISPSLSLIPLSRPHMNRSRKIYYVNNIYLPVYLIKILVNCKLYRFYFSSEKWD